MSLDPGPIKVFGVVGALSFIIEGILLPVAVVAHIFLLLASRWMAYYYNNRQIYTMGLFWFATALTASLTTAAALRLTIITAFLTNSPYLAHVAAAWIVTTVPFYILMERAYKATGVGLFKAAGMVYVAGAALFYLKAGVFLLAYAFVLLGVAMSKVK
ncbi:MAG: respiratory chain protein [Pyrobaculum sp.]